MADFESAKKYAGKVEITEAGALRLKGGRALTRPQQRFGKPLPPSDLLDRTSISTNKGK